MALPVIAPNIDPQHRLRGIFGDLLLLLGLLSRCPNRTLLCRFVALPIRAQYGAAQLRSFAANPYQPFLCI
jgi:hypothetical protein